MTRPTRLLLVAARMYSDVHVRFWLEFQNPTTPPYAAAAGPLGDGSVKLQYNAAELGPNPTFSPYQIVIVQNAKATPTISQSLRDPAGTVINVRGDIGVAADLIFNFTNAAQPGW